MATTLAPPPRGDDAHQERRVLGNQVIEEKASRRVLERQIEETKGAGVSAEIVDELVRAHDQHGRIIRRVEGRIQELEKRLFV
ncbi:MAG: hypothetical protein QXO51_02270 [Halobacteria archaeon]